MNRQNLPRIAIASIAILGLLETTYLTIAELAGKAEDICPNSGCRDVLNSPYAQIFGIPLPFFGLLAYSLVAILAISPWLMAKTAPKRRQWEQNTWSWLLFVTTAMAVSSLYLMSVMIFKIQGICPYCVASALFSLSLFFITIMGHKWYNWRQLTLISLIAAIATLTGVLGVYASVDYTAAKNPQTQEVVAVKSGEKAPAITTQSGESEIGLANHLQEIDAKVFVAYTCPHCHEQKQLFGKEAADILTKIECNPNGENAQPQLCEAAGIKGVPTWEINGEFYSGVQSLEKIAELSGYTGSQEFINPFPY
jgi:uncharacterized membrane protein